MTTVDHYFIIRYMSKYKVNKEQLNRLSEQFKALSNPHRLDIFLYLAEYCFPWEPSTEEEMRTTVGELKEGLGVVASTVSHHLKELRQAGLIRMERKGKNVECWVEPETLEGLRQFFEIVKKE